MEEKLATRFRATSRAVPMAESTTSILTLITNIFCLPQPDHATAPTLPISSNNLLRHLILYGAKLKLDERSEDIVANALKELASNGSIDLGANEAGTLTLASVRSNMGGNTGKRKQQEFGTHGGY